MRRRAAPLAAAAVGAAAFVLYHATLLPDMDLGDTPSFQARIGTALLSPRDAYPLYTAIGTVFHWIVKGTPAHALNLASAVEGALACAVIVLVGVELSGSVSAAAAAALLFAVSYTFWSQSIIAEVYALHLIFVALTLLLALRWPRQPTLGCLALLFATYAIGFGNHLSMILLAPGLTIYLFAAAPGGWRSMLAPRVLAVAAACACVGALQYAWNIHTLWLLPEPPHGVADALQRFWFDVTKADWRETMVLESTPGHGGRPRRDVPPSISTSSSARPVCSSSSPGSHSSSEPTGSRPCWSSSCISRTFCSRSATTSAIHTSSICRRISWLRFLRRPRSSFWGMYCGSVIWPPRCSSRTWRRARGGIFPRWTAARTIGPQRFSLL